ncbi:MAG: formylglycine-generating enzyme family protein [Desulfobacteraceae bacterium]|nr:formylglycine-generating enzyme family protein [Desulfobacteraceae bacterium]
MTMLNIPRNSARFSGLFLAAFILITVSAFHVLADEKTFTNSLGMDFVLIPEGTFTMGSPTDELNRDGDEKRHQVTISKSFYMQTTEVTVKQWRAVMGKQFLFKKKGTEDMPVVRVSWADCMDFIGKLNALNQGTYRLPTEAEWEYACRSGSTSAYSWGKTIDCTQAMYGNNTLKIDICVKSAQSKGLPADQPAPVKTYKPNAWGLYDMEGNAWEWCQDWYERYETGEAVDPRGSKSGTDKVRRGGSWYGVGYRCRCANRTFSNPASRYETTGFRLVRETQ